MATYEEKDDAVRKELIELVNEILGKNNTKDSITYGDTFLDITGSNGCWGIR